MALHATRVTQTSSGSVRDRRSLLYMNLIRLSKRRSSTLLYFTAPSRKEEINRIWISRDGIQGVT